MSYVSSVIGYMVADDIMRRKMELTKLQEELFVLVADFVYNDGQTYEECTKDCTWEEYCEALKKNIKTMNAAELRHNIKLWKDSE